MIDMHVHSTWSDGSASPLALVRQAKALGLSGIALTDHDTFSGTSELAAAGRALGVMVHGGIEISCTQPGTGRQLHLLGYGVPPENRDQVEDFCQEIRKSRDAAVREATHKLEKAGYPVSVGQVEALAGPGGSLCKQYIMRLLVEAGLCEGMYGPLYKALFKTGENGNPPLAALRFETAHPLEAVRCVVHSGGKAVLAHPGQYDNFAYLPALLKAGLSGIEAYHPLHNKSAEERCLRLAQEYSLAVTGGSDFHGLYGEGEQMGQRTVQRYPF